jgi:23S rRNA (guanine2445-N2)-methyltransferase
MKYGIKIVMESNKYIAKTSFGLEDILAKELEEIGTSDINKYKRAVEFKASEKLLYEANLSLRTCLRILKPLHSFSAVNSDQLYKKTRQFNWNSFIAPNETIAIDGVTNSEYFTHSKYAALKVKDAIVDQIRDAKGKRPNVELKNPTYRLNVHIERDKCSILLDSSGDSLHKRGYRIHGGIAPLNEVLAAGMILLSEWDLNSNFVDPMCGSGTILIEAVLMMKNIAPNINRKHFGFMNWKSFDRGLFLEVKNELISKQGDCTHTVIGNDISSDTIDIAKTNAEAANVLEDINLVVGDFKILNHSLEDGTIITNPPYDERIKQTNINNFYKDFGDTLKNNFTGFDAWVLSSNNEALKHLGLRTSSRLHLYNGPLEARFHNYKMYKGSKKKKYE